MSTPSIFSSPRECPLASALAKRLHASREALVTHWLDRITARTTLAPNQVFPTHELLDHVPLLIDGIADYVESPAAEVSTDMPVVGKAMELGTLRHRQGFDAYQIMKEYELLGGILFNFLAYAVDQMPEPCEKSELLTCGHRLFRAIAIIQQTTTTQFLRLADERVAERETRLRAFNRMVSHELKNDLGAILGAGDLLLTLSDLSGEQQVHFKEMIVSRARSMKETIDSMIELSRLETDVRTHRHVRLPQAAQEAQRQVREAAQAAGVAVRLSPDLPDVEVNAAVVELALTNYLSNAIKYAAQRDGGSFAEISGHESSGPSGPEVVVCVRDNGLGVPTDERARLFERFFRAQATVTAAEGTGLGLSIVRDMVESVGGRVWAQFPEEGSAFFIALPTRRGTDEPAAASS